MRLLAFILLIPALALGQSLHTFENGQVADAQKINENFNYVLENASGGCTVEQVDNSAQITCADGSTAVVPGYGTVVIVPEGSASGEVPPEVISGGTITLVHGNGDYVGPFRSIVNSGADTVVEVSSEFEINRSEDEGGVRNFYMNFYNNSAAQQVYVTDGGCNSQYCSQFWYVEPDCAGVAYMSFTIYSSQLFHFERRFHATPDNAADGGHAAYDVVVRSYRDPDRFVDFDWQESPCVNQTQVKGLFTYTLDVTPPPEWDNIVYPVTLKQEPN